MALRAVSKATFEVKDSRSLQEGKTSESIAILFMRFGEQKENCSLHLVYTPKDEYPIEEIKFVKENGQLLVEGT